MEEARAYLDGRWIAAGDLRLPVVDTGFVLGATVAEQLRTFGGKLFHLERHLQRLGHSLEIVGVRPPQSPDELAEIARRLVAHNHGLLRPGDDLGLSIFITPGVYPAYGSPGGQRAGGTAEANDSGSDVAPPPPDIGRPVVCMHTYPLPFHLWSERYGQGQALAITDVRQVPRACWPPELKCRSRMHYYLADRKAAEAHPGARALLLDVEGFVTEASTANLLIFRRGQGLISPPEDCILHGISLGVTFELATRLGIEVHTRPLRPEDVAEADEAILSSTPFALLPATRLDGKPIGSGLPGDVFARLLRAFGELVGVDIAGQARRFSDRP